MTSVRMEMWLWAANPSAMESAFDRKTADSSRDTAALRNDNLEQIFELPTTSLARGAN
jgi:hypothetical protein